MIKQFGIEIKWGIIFSVMTLIWMVLEKSVGLHDQYIDKQMIYTNLIAIPVIILYFMALSEQKKKFYHGRMDFKEGLKAGLVMTLVIAILSPLIQYITTMYITPMYFTNMIKYSVGKKMLTLDQAQQYFSLNNYLKQSAYGALVMGVLTSAIVAAFLKSKVK